MVRIADGAGAGGRQVNEAHNGMQEAAAAAGAKATRLAALRDLVERTLAGMGYELVELERAAGGLLRVTLDLDPAAVVGDPAMADAAPAAAAGDPALGDAAPARHVGIEDCEQVSRHLTHLFAVEEVDYERLEVSSPGLDRPLRGARDFARFAGEMAKVQLFSAVDGRRRLRGRLLGLVPAADGADEAARRVRMTLVPEAAPAPARGVRRSRAKAPAELPTVEFAIGEVEKARLAPEWEFDREAIGRAVPSRAG